MYVGTPEDEFLLVPQPPPLGVRLSDAQCHALAYRSAFAGLGHVSPNPLVGCVITDAQGCLLAIGSHRRYGEAHAEADAIAQVLARGGAECLRGARVFVTLQPCTHHGKTPPCSELLLRYGVGELHYGMDDPNPQVSSLEKLKQAGIACHKYEHRELQWLDEAYFFHAERKSGTLVAQPHARPFVAAKIAAGLDGSFATKKLAKRLRLSGERALQYGHFLRQRYDAILVGAGTLRLDDPRLDMRVDFPQRRTPRRVMLADVASLHADLQLFEVDPHTIIVVVPETEAVRAAALLPSGALLLPLPRQTEGGFDLWQLLQVLYGEHGIYSLLLEGGGRLWASFFTAGLVDKVHLFQSPCLHPQARHWGAELSGEHAVVLRDMRMLPLGSDWVVEGATPQSSSHRKRS